MDNGRCVQSCASKFYESRKASSGAQSLFCVSGDECSKVVKTNNMYLCVDTCSYPTAFVKNGVTISETQSVKQCVSSCPKYEKNNDTGEYVCIGNSDENYISIQNNARYVDVCPKWLPFRMGQECVQACPDNYHFAGNNQCV